MQTLLLQNADQATSKLAYEPPTLSFFGKIANLTQASSGPCLLDGTQGFCIMANMAMDG
jgi:hypothetical protein